MVSGCNACAMKDYEQAIRVLAKESQAFDAFCFLPRRRKIIYDILTSDAVNTQNLTYPSERKAYCEIQLVADKVGRHDLDRAQPSNDRQHMGIDLEELELFSNGLGERADRYRNQYYHQNL